MLGDRAAVHRAEKVVQQPLSRRRIVEDVAHERRLRGLLDKILQSLRRGRESFQEKRIDRGVPGRREYPGHVRQVDQPGGVPVEQHQQQPQRGERLGGTGQPAYPRDDVVAPPRAETQRPSRPEARFMRGRSLPARAAPSHR